MKKFRIVLSILIVFLLNVTALYTYCYVTDDDNTNVIDGGSLFDVLANGNEITKKSDYGVDNWSSNSKTTPKEKAEIISILENADCRKSSKFTACFVKLLQTSRNSISELDIIEYNNVKKEDANRVAAWLGNVKKSAISCDVVKLFNNYYLICTYMKDADDIENFSNTAVYKVTNSKEIQEIDNYQKENEYFYPSYPEGLYFIRMSNFWIVLLIGLFIFEVFVIYKISNKFAKKKNIKNISNKTSKKKKKK